MAEEDSEFELEGFKKQLRSLFDSFLREELGRESDIYCARFCEVRLEGYLGQNIGTEIKPTSLAS